MPTEKVYDIIGIGIGPFNVGMTALCHEIPELNCLFIDQNESFNWQMDIEIVDEKTGPVYLANIIPPTLTHHLITNAIPFVLNEPNYQVLFQMLPGEGFRIWYSIYKIGKERVVLKARGSVPVLQLRIAVKNCIKGTWDKILQPELPEYYFGNFTPLFLPVPSLKQTPNTSLSIFILISRSWKSWELTTKCWR